jgi:hypothetical protein
VGIFVPAMEMAGVGNIGPNRGSFLWELGTMVELWDTLGNRVYDISGTDSLIGAFVWGNFTWLQNTLENVVFTGGYAVTSAAVAAGVSFSGNKVTGSLFLDLTGVTTGGFSNNTIVAGGSMVVTSGAGPVNVSGSMVTAASFLVPVGGAAAGCRVSSGATLNTGAFTATNVKMDDASSVTLTANNTNTYKGFGVDTLV